MCSIGLHLWFQFSGSGQEINALVFQTDACGFYKLSSYGNTWKYSTYLLTTFATFRMDFFITGYLEAGGGESSLYFMFWLSMLSGYLVFRINPWVLGMKWSAWGFGSWQRGWLAGAVSLIIQQARQELVCLLPSIIAFSAISSAPRMCPGLLFLTSVSYTDPDQFVYKTQPPREQPDTFPDVMMNSYLGSWPLRWQINCLGHGHLRIFFLIHTEHKSFYFLFHFKRSTHKKHAMVEGL